MATIKRKHIRKQYTLQDVKTHILMLIATITIIVCNSCGNNGKDTAEGKARIEQLRRINDSITQLAPSAKKLIEDRLASAPDSITFYEYTLCKAHFLSLSEKPETAMPYINKVIGFAKKEKTESTCNIPNERLNSLLAGAYSCQGAYMHNFHRDNNKTVELYEEAYDLLTASDTKHNMPNVCANLADAYIMQNDIPQAARWYRRALFLVDSLRLPKKENITLYMGLAQIYLSLRDFDTALLYYNKTERYFNSMTPSMQAYFLNNFGNYHYFRKDYKAALATFLRLKRNIERHGMQDKFDMFLCKVNLADVYLNLDSLEQASKYLNEAESYFRKQHDPAALYYCNTIRIGIATKKGDTKLVEKILAHEDNTEQMASSMVNVRNTYIQNYFEKTGNYKEALRNMKQSVAYNDSLEHNRANMRAADIMARFTSDTLKLHHDLIIEHKNTDIQRAKRDITLAVALTMVMALLLIVWLLYYKKKRIETKNDIVNLKLNIVRNRISPHFVFNVLNNKIISSEQHEASELTELSRLIRANLDMSRQSAVTLDSELTFVEQYVRVEQYLLGDDFTFNVDIDEAVDRTRVMVPSMFLQILTENAIIHGLKGRDGHKDLRIRVRREQTSTVITVEDNGPGFCACNGSAKKRTGLGIIAQTVAANNEHNKRKMRFDIRNKTNNDGTIAGCIATLKVPDGVKFI